MRQTANRRWVGIVAGLVAGWVLPLAGTAQAGVVVTPAAGYSMTWDGNDGDFFDPADPAWAPPNLAGLATVGAFGSSQYGAGVHLIANAKDGRYGNSNSWLATAADTNPYIGLNLGGTYSISGIAWGRDNGNNVTDPAGGQLTDRSLGVYTLQVTRVASPGTGTPETGDPATGWANVAALDYQSNDDAAPGGAFTSYFRHQYGLADNGQPVQATGVRIKVPDAPSFSGQICIDEIELYTPAAPPDPRVPAAGLTSWLRADRGVVTDAGGNVSAWTDQSGNYNSAAQTVPGNRPSVADNALAGKPVIDFSGSGVRHLNILDAASLGIQSSDYEMFVVARSGSGAIQFLTAASHTVGAENYELHLNGAAAARFIPNQPWTTQAVDLGSSGFLTTGEPHVFNVRVEAETGLLRVDGVQSSDSAANARSASGQWLTLGVRGSATYPLTGDIAEVLIYDRALTAAERASVEQYLISRWEIPINVAGASRGAVPFAKDVLGGYASHQIAHLNDETYGNSNSWIAGSANSFAGVAFDQPYAINAIAFGRDNGGSETTGGPNNDGQFTDRFLGTYTLQYTTALNPDETTPDSEWLDIATLAYDGTFPDATGYLRHLWQFDTVPWATGVRIRTSANGICIDEIEVHGVAVPEPATLGLLALALGGLGGYFRRRSR